MPAIFLGEGALNRGGGGGGLISNISHKGGDNRGRALIRGNAV